jgi:6-phosphogluconolactonase
VSTPPGTGPRHALFHPNGKLVFVNTELAGGLNIYRWDAAKGALTLTQSLTTDTSADPAKRSSAEIAFSKDGRFLYVSNRGDNTIAVYTVDAAAGRVSEIQRVVSQGKIPWSFTIDPSGRWMLVANEASSEVTELKVDAKTGRIEATDQRLAAPNPVHIAYFPR